MSRGFNETRPEFCPAYFGLPEYYPVSNNTKITMFNS